ncbi:ESPR domain-containing protein [Acinetobacter baumannii]|nr:ESPR domain-containing protein [Acinetobacter baumannii]
MNKIYRLIWNEVLGIWVTASELSKARGKRNLLVIKQVKIALVNIIVM